MLLYTMNNYTIRILLFLFGCIGARIMLAYIVQLYGIQYKNELTALLLIPACGFTYIYMNGLRKTGIEVFKGKIWWNALRPFHAFMYFLAAYFVFTTNNSAYKVILADTLVGFIAFVCYHLHY